LYETEIERHFDKRSERTKLNKGV